MDTICAWIFCLTPGWDNMGEIRISIPCENQGLPYLECKNILSTDSHVQFLRAINSIWLKKSSDIDKKVNENKFRKCLIFKVKVEKLNFGVQIPPVLQRSLISVVLLP